MIYVHVPFCDKKCYYCNYVSYQNKAFVKKYFSAVNKELESRKNNILTTSVFIGGGTPTSVDCKHIKKVLTTIKNNFNLSKNCEITIEANPKSTTKQKLDTYFKSGINRLSFGVQSLNNKTLFALGRNQTKKQVTNAIKFAKKAGFKNISADLMLGLPNQNFNQIVKDAKKLIKWGVVHISAYMLVLENNTKLHTMVKNNQIALPDDDETVKVYNSLHKFLKAKGFERYEVSNFAKNQLYSTHNLGYWQMKEYVGIGAAAHSFQNNQRLHNSSNLFEYVAGKGVKVEKLSKAQIKEETIMLGLRTKFGISKNLVANNKNLNNLIKDGFVLVGDDFVKVHPNQFGVLNSIIVKLVEED